MSDDTLEVAEREEGVSEEEMNLENEFDAMDDAMDDEPEKTPEDTSEGDDVQPGEDGAKTAPEKGAEEEAGKKAEGQEEPSAHDRLSERVKELGYGKEEPDRSTSAGQQEPGSGDRRAGGEAPGSKLTKEKVADYLKGVSLDDLPEEMIIGDSTINLKEFASEFPDEFNNSVVIGAMMAERIANQMLEGAGYADQGAVQELQNTVADLQFWQTVSQVHPDVQKLNFDPKYAEWIEKNPAYSKLAKNLVEPQDAIDLINAYKEDQAKAKAADHDKKARGKKDKKDAVHSSTVGGGRSGGGKGGGEPVTDADLEAEFDAIPDDKID